jgi:hypothetical protein
MIGASKIKMNKPTKIIILCMLSVYYVWDIYLGIPLAYEYTYFPTLIGYFWMMFILDFIMNTTLLYFAYRYLLQKD